MMPTAVAVAAIVLLGFASGWFSHSGHRNPWFVALAKPWFMPPGWVFPVVWTTLYFLMGVAVARIWTAPAAPMRTAALGLFAIQLALNLAWSPIFFAARRIGGALAVIALLDVAVVATIAAFGAIARLPALLLLPYLGWLGLATALNLAIRRLNRPLPKPGP